VKARRANIGLQRTAPCGLAAEAGSLGGRSRTVAGMVVAAVLFGGLAAGTMPVLRDRLSPDEALVLADMADGRVRASTIQVATRALFSHEFGNFHAALWLGHAVREGLASEDEVRAAFRSYLCDSPRSGRPCNFVFEYYSGGLRVPSQGPAQSPLCIDDCSNLFSGDAFRQLRAAVDHSLGTPGIVALVRSIPEETIQAAFCPPWTGRVMVGGGLPSEDQPLQCTMRAWRSTQEPPNRWRAYLLKRECDSR
jgi:hypothetical protein